MSNRGITIKVATSKVLSLLEDKLTEMEQSLVDYEILQADFKSKLSAWEKKCVSVAVKQSSKAVETQVGHNWSSSISGSLKVTMFFDPALFPPRPEEPEVVRRGKYHLESEVTDLRDVVRMLKLHEGDTVSTATYKSISRFL